ncbi:MAG: PAS domain S-box protein [Gallionella sp.]|nr:PAS domain S-box protein [Gallionella sp.]
MNTTATILVIDDSADDQRLYQRALKEAGYSLEMASTAEAGLARIADSGLKCPDLILLDYNLPDMDGLGFMNRLAGYSAGAIPVIMLTGEGSVEIAVEVMKHGAKDYLAKDTAGHYLKLLPGIITRSLVALREHEFTRRLRNETEMLLKRNRALMLSSIDGIHIMDIHGNLIEANDSFCKMLGYTQTEVAGLNVADWNAQWSVDELRAKFKNLVGKSARFETVHRRKDGTLINVEVSSSGVEVEGQSLFFASSRDITERKKTEAMLMRHKLVLDTSIDGFWVNDMLGNLLEANEAYAKMSGYTVEELVTMHISQLEAKEQTEDVKAHLAKIEAQGYDRFETRHRHKDGHEIEIEISATYMAEPPQLVVFCRDITERKRAGDALLKSEANLRAMLDNSPYLTWLKDTEGRYIMVNKVFADYLRLEDARQVIGRTDLDLQPKELADKYRADDAEVMAACQPKHVEEAAFDGSKVHWVGTYKTPIIDEQGKVLGTVGFAKDITERKLTEEELRVAAAAFETQDAIVIADADWNIIRVNQAVQSITGYIPEELLGKHYSILDAGQRGDDSCIRILQQQIDNGTWAGEIWDRRKNGQIYPKWLTITAVRNEQLEIIRYVVIFSDITARKQVEEQKLRESDGRFRGTLEQAAVGIVHTTLDGHFRQVNQKFCKITGYARDELNRMSLQDVTFPDDLGKSVEYMQQLLAGEISTFSVESRYVRKDQVLVWVNLTVSLLCDADGVPKYNIVVVEDITERKQAEALAQRFGRLLQSSFNEIYLFDADSLHFLQVSEGARKNLGYSPAELQQLTPLDLRPSFTREEFERHIAPLRTGQQPVLFFEADHRRKDGTTYPVEVRLQLMGAGTGADSAVFMAVIQDINERKQAEDLLNQSMQQIEDLYNHAPCGYHSLDRDGIIRIINDTELVWLGYSRDELVGKMHWTDLLTPAGKQTFRDTFPQLKKFGVVHDVETEIIRKNGTVFTALINATAIYDADGNYLMSRSTITDITGRKHAENMARKLAMHLQTVREEEKVGIAREIHDDLGGTLSSLKMEAYWLKSELPAGMREMGGGAVSAIMRLQSMSQLIDNAVGVTRRIITGLRPAILDDFGLLAAIEWQCAQFQQRTGIECRVNCIENLGTLDKLCSIALFRILQEALTNVMRYSGATLVEIEFLHGNDEVMLSISDNGCGLPENYVVEAGHYGMLGMIERAVQLGGQVRFDSEPGRGLGVVVILPLSAADNEGKEI